jgi:hypothetical protein
MSLNGGTILSLFPNIMSITALSWKHLSSPEPKMLHVKEELATANSMEVIMSSQPGAHNHPKRYQSENAQGTQMNDFNTASLLMILELKQ